jgi:hypothetical protein
VSLSPRLSPPPRSPNAHSHTGGQPFSLLILSMYLWIYGLNHKPLRFGKASRKDIKNLLSTLLAQNETRASLEQERSPRPSVGVHTGFPLGSPGTWPLCGAWRFSGPRRGWRCGGLGSILQNLEPGCLQPCFVNESPAAPPWGPETNPALNLAFPFRFLAII